MTPTDYNPLTDPDRYMGAIHVHANGVIETDPAEPVATVCGACGRAWDDDIITAVTPTPAGRCPFEADHTDPDVCPACLRSDDCECDPDAYDITNR
jgi:hypothetical protein